MSGIEEEASLCPAEARRNKSMRDFRVGSMTNSGGDQELTRQPRLRSIDNKSPQLWASLFWEFFVFVRLKIAGKAQHPLFERFAHSGENVGGLGQRIKDCLRVLTEGCGRGEQP